MNFAVFSAQRFVGVVPFAHTLVPQVGSSVIVEVVSPFLHRLAIRRWVNARRILL